MGPEPPSPEPGTLPASVGTWSRPFSWPTGGKRDNADPKGNLRLRVPRGQEAIDSSGLVGIRSARIAHPSIRGTGLPNQASGPGQVP